ncbi:protein kinase domain-containing protein [Parafrankia discariae]|uniref:protein kinase domain-containing protein n=1 Tax=Parafrankia discariae TaxID=365528 RepID=UPI000374C842|nr:protein kinase [Parafrankia discariae]
MLTPLTDDDPRQVGRYRLHNRIGAGGMGTVYLGFAPGSEPVAVKVAAAELSEDDEFRSRFEREVRAALRVRGGAVASVLDADTSASQPWMVTEYVEGVSLADAVRRRGRLEAHLVRGLAVGLADALVAIHAAGVVHRDLKPSNILLAWDGPKVIDFGIAQLTDSATLTRTGHVIGTLAWMAPEQMRGESAGTAADVFAWASCVTYAATGRHPFHADAPDLLAQRVQRDEPDLDAVPPQLRGLVGQALAKAPRERPGASSLLAALVGHEVHSVTDADAAAGSVLEQTWTGPSPAFGTPPAVAARPAARPAGFPPAAPPPTGPSVPAGGSGSGGSARSSPSGWANSPGPAWLPGVSPGPGRSSPSPPTASGPVGPPPPASAFRATSGPGLARRGPGGPGQPGERADGESTYRPADPVPPAGPPDPRAWPARGAAAPGRPASGADPAPPPYQPGRTSAGPAPFPVPSGYAQARPGGPAVPAAPAAVPEAPAGYPPPIGPTGQVGAGLGRPSAAGGRSPTPRRAGQGSGPFERWNTCALLSLALGILWIFGLGSVAAVGLGYAGRLQIRRRGQRGSLAATVGIGLGWLGIATTAVIGALVWLIF